ncbi:MAG TPA: ABC transporter substrate-binding protein [Chloroflexota bacterium]|nr:ABC transporter substrate-binding protein [Chloroflexota bacterium]
MPLAGLPGARAAGRRWIGARWLAVATVLLAAACAAGSTPAAQAPAAATGAAAPGADSGSPAAASATAPVPAQDVTVAIPAQSLSTFPIVLGQEAGIYTRHGINLSVVTMASNAAIAAVIGGSVDFATPAGSIVRAINQGAPLRVVAAVSDKSNHILVVDPTVIRDGKDLAGKTIAVNEVGGNTQLEAQAALQRFGLDRDSANYVAVLDNSQRLAALKAGAAQAAISNVPFNLVAEQMGLKVLLNFAEFYELPTAVLGASEAKLADNAPSVQRTVAATLEALRYVRDEKEPAAAAIARLYDMPPDQAAAAYDLSRDTWSATGRLSQTAYENSLDPADVSHALPLDRVVDARFLDAAH